ncbi:hypothetical protein HIM_09466 [Hirsutella minnesotensis 3608]|uniref:TLC domain-containing protein n=1 Tax=Hirsutella minnesotensis 3608 TaxID=1043627 RepID=A0A0F7ZXQ1_9HYPO|nr:hypothetical protein HIM_09466 [Hirsutella minnesotensis 3608]
MAEPKIATVANQALSVLLPYGTLIFCSSVLAIILVSDGLERWLLPRLYGKVWAALRHGDKQRRRHALTRHHLFLLVMLPLSLVGAYPTFDFLVTRDDLSAPLAAGHQHRTSVTIGDSLFTLTHIYTAYYLFELCFYYKFSSAIVIVHHIGLIIVAQVALVLFVDLQAHPEATMEFYMCLIWGLLDITVKVPQFSAMIVRQVKDSDRTSARIAYACCAWVLLGAMVQVAVTAYLLNRSWSRWRLTWRIVVPIILSLWISTQLEVAFKLARMARFKHPRARRDIEGSNPER